MIDEKKLIEDIDAEIKCMNAEKEIYFKDGNFHNGNIIVEQISAIKIIKKIIRNQPKNGSWIYCGDKCNFPRESGEYDTIVSDYEIFATLNYDKEDNTWYDKDGDFRDVIAWNAYTREVKSDE